MSAISTERGKTEARTIADALKRSPSFIGIDVGGTKIAGGLTTFPGSKLAQRVISTHPERGGPAVLNDVIALARELSEEAKSIGSSVAGIGLGICELVDREGRLASANCIQWLDLPVREKLSAIAPVVMEADVRAAALAEAVHGTGKAFRSFLYVTIGTGISCCLMIHGIPYLGARGASGTMASSPLSIPCELCGQTSRRTLEEIASGPALVARFRQAGGHAVTGQEVVAAASAGGDLARQVIASATTALGSQVGLLVSVLDPEAIVVGGGLGLSDGPFWNEFVASTRSHIWSSLHRELPILRAGLGEDAGWIGAALKAFQNLNSLQATQTQ